MTETPDQSPGTPGPDEHARTTESPNAGPSAGAGQQSDPTAPRTGVDRGNLRNYERLRRSVTDRKIAGVAGGLGRHLNVDPTILRVLFVVLCFFGGAGFLLYGAAWLLVPEEGKEHSAVMNVDDSTRNTLLIIAGAIAALLLVGDSWGGFGFPWPLALIGLVILLVTVLKGQDRSRGSQQPPAAYGTYPPPTTETPNQELPVTDNTDPTYSGYPTGPGVGYAEPTPPWAPPAPAAPARPSRPPKTGPRLFGPTLALLAIALGSLGLYEAAGGDVVDSAYAALALAVVGAMLVLGSFLGRPGGLVFLGIVASIALAITSVAGFNWGEGDQLRRTPTTASDVQNNYRLDSGQVFLDLSELSDPQNLDGRTIDVSAEAGELVVVLPEGIRSRVDAEIDGPGAIETPRGNSGGIGNSIDETFGSGDATVSINADLSVGHIEVRNP